MLILPFSQVIQTLLFLSISQSRGVYFLQHSQNQSLFIPTTSSGPASFILAWALLCLPAGPHVLLHSSLPLVYFQWKVRLVLLISKLGYVTIWSQSHFTQHKSKCSCHGPIWSVFLLVILGSLMPLKHRACSLCLDSSSFKQPHGSFISSHLCPGSLPWPFPLCCSIFLILVPS